MANRTVKDAKTIKGTNPQYLIEKIIRTRIYESKFWKEECFALTGNIFRWFVCLAHGTADFMLTVAALTKYRPELNSWSCETYVFL